MTKPIAPNDFDRRDPPRLDRAIRDGRRSSSAIRAAYPDRRPVLRGLALLWHDHWDEAHEIAQSDEGEREHDLLHYLVHRREGDFGNAAYWLRGAEKHPCFARIADGARTLLPSGTLRDEILPDDAWSARGFLQAVRRSGEDGESPHADLLRRLQAEEFIAFAEWLSGDAR